MLQNFRYSYIPLQIFASQAALRLRFFFRNKDFIILEAGGRIKKEELKNSHIIVYWLWKEKEDEETGEKRPLPNPFIIEFGRLINSVPA
ncbi:hypothetical protein [Neobacillus drentensis]|uniref:hypothetical protein n=1 Tax=Neobacillus drentensis TaxID=220684 RepID=UPI0030039B02